MRVSGDTRSIERARDGTTRSRILPRFAADDEDALAGVTVGVRVHTPSAGATREAATGRIKEVARQDCAEPED